jgi:glyoxylase-like metal-dependent hydrolase (beta-lactamase superfamily II)
LLSTPRKRHHDLSLGSVGVDSTTPRKSFYLIKSRLFDELPDDTWFYPGHGDDSTLGKERPKLGEWRARGW